jgi:tRNA (guanine37-N1)-methyltransferase
MKQAQSQAGLKINVLTCCPEYFASVLQSSILGRAIQTHQVIVEVLCLRDFAAGNKKKITDDEPYGGGAGQILKIEPIVKALDWLEEKGCKGQVYLTSPRGEIFNQDLARAWAKVTALTFICGHYEGVDERVLAFIDGQISLGQFVLTGGEPVAAAIIDSVVRLIPGVLGNQASLAEESFNEPGLIEYPQYTRPQVFRGLKVPEILLSGHHADIAAWRRQQSQAHQQSLKQTQPPETN